MQIEDSVMKEYTVFVEDDKEQLHKKAAIIQDSKFGEKIVITTTEFFNLTAIVWKD